MAQHQVGNLEANGIVSRAKAVSGSVAVSSNIFATPANYTSNASLDARLATINAGIYTQARLDQMTANDKIYAIRLNDDPLTV